MATPKDVIEVFGEAIIREYLSRRDCKQTLAAFDMEKPRDEQTLTSRSEMAKGLKLEKLMKKNKANPKTYPSMLEVMLLKWMAKSGATGSHSNMDALRSSTRQPATPSSRPPSIDMDSLIRQEIRDRKSEWDEEKAPGERPKSSKRRTHPSAPAGVAGPTGGTTRSSGGAASVDVESELIARPLSSRGGRSSTASQLARPRSGRASPDLSRPARSSSRMRHANDHEIEDEIDNFLEEVEKVDLVDDDDDGEDDLVIGDSHNVVYSNMKLESKRPARPPSGMGQYSQQPQHPSLNLSTAEMSFEDQVEHVGAGFSVRPSPRPKTAGGVHRPDSAMGMRTSMPLDPTGDVHVEDWADSDDDRQTYMGAHHDKPPSRVGMARPATAPVRQSVTITVDIAREIRQLIFGRQAEFHEAWHQGFTFVEEEDLRYGVHQEMGGPCGIIACVQAYFLEAHLFKSKLPSQGELFNPSPSRRREMLVYSISRILWQAGDETNAKVVVSKSREFSAQITKNMSEMCTVHDFNTYESLQRFVMQNHQMFDDPKGPGVILMLFSLILSRGLDGVKADMDDPNNTLIAKYGYCSQELVNLMLVGRAVTNVFNGQVYLEGSGDDDGTVLRGIAFRSHVGYLTLLEKYNYLEVGDFLKNASYPIWVVCSESHYSVLFALDRDVDSNNPFDLYYFDGLARQDEVIKLTVTIGNSPPDISVEDSPPLESVIRTKWPNGSVDWNGVDPIL